MNYEDTDALPSTKSNLNNQNIPSEIFQGESDRYKIEPDEGEKAEEIEIENYIDNTQLSLSDKGEVAENMQIEEQGDVFENS